MIFSRWYVFFFADLLGGNALAIVFFLPSRLDDRKVSYHFFRFALFFKLRSTFLFQFFFTECFPMVIFWLPVEPQISETLSIFYSARCSFFKSSQIKCICILFIAWPGFYECGDGGTAFFSGQRAETSLGGFIKAAPLPIQSIFMSPKMETQNEIWTAILKRATKARVRDGAAEWCFMIIEFGGHLPPPWFRIAGNRNHTRRTKPNIKKPSDFETDSPTLRPPHRRRARNFNTAVYPTPENFCTSPPPSKKSQSFVQSFSIFLSCGPDFYSGYFAEWFQSYFSRPVEPQIIWNPFNIFPWLV